MTGILDQIQWARGTLTIDEALAIKRFHELVLSHAHDLIRTRRPTLRVCILERLYDGSYLVDSLQRLTGIEPNCLKTRLCQLAREGLVCRSESHLWQITAAAAAVMAASTRRARSV